MTSRLPFVQLRIPLALALVFTVTAGLGDAYGDDVNVRGLWYSNVTVQKFANGKVYFRTTAGNVVVADLRDLQTLKVKNLPVIEHAEESYDLEDYKAAIKRFKQVRSKARTKWLGQWIDYRLIQCLRKGIPMDMDVYDAAAWSVVSQLSERSVADRGRTMDFPDFTRGPWKTNPPLAIVGA